MPDLIAFAAAQDRCAAHLSAQVLAVERAMGAYNARSVVAIELRLAEARRHAVNASRSAHVLTVASRQLPGIDLPWNELQTGFSDLRRQNSDSTIGAMLDGERVERFLATGVDERIPNLPLSRLGAPESRTLLGVATFAGATWQFAADLAQHVPASVSEFLSDDQPLFDT